MIQRLRLNHKVTKSQTTLSRLQFVVPKEMDLWGPQEIVQLTTSSSSFRQDRVFKNKQSKLAATTNKRVIIGISMSENRALQRANILANHILRSPPLPSSLSLAREVCLQYSPPELNESYGFDVKEMRRLLDGHNTEDRDWLYGLMMQSNLFNRKERGGKIFVSPDYNQTMEQQREITMKRIWYLLEKGVYRGWLTGSGPEAELKKLALLEVCGIYDHSLSIKLGVHFFLWYVSIYT